MIPITIFKKCKEYKKIKNGRPREVVFTLEDGANILLSRGQLNIRIANLKSFGMSHAEEDKALQYLDK